MFIKVDRFEMNPLCYKISEFVMKMLLDFFLNFFPNPRFEAQSNEYGLSVQINEFDDWYGYRS